MKYLERYSVIHSLLEQSSNLSEDDFTELKEFCDNSLAYLLDDGYEIKLTRDRIQTGYNYYEDGYMVVTLHFPGDNYNTNDSYATTKEFHWNDVKDYYIPFIQLLSNRYEILIQTPYISDYVVKIGANYSGYYHYTYETYEDIINDRVGVTKFNSIIVRVKEKAKI